MKTYTIYFTMKQNSTAFIGVAQVEAATAKEACARCKAWYHAKTGRNAFRPTTTLADVTREWADEYNKWVRFDEIVKG
jgi:hypothetical protein